jgi:hypothetical protein
MSTLSAAKHHDANPHIPGICLEKKAGLQELQAAQETMWCTFY